MKIIISVIICTRNRSDLLTNILNDLVHQNPISLMYFEVIIIDNGSNDTTHEVVNEIANNNSLIRYIFEPEIGLSHARNRGWQEAQGNYVAYVDDDCRVPADWISTAQDIIDKQSPLAFGGPYLPFYLSSKPVWFKNAYGSYQDGEYPNTARAAENFNLCGGNFFVQRKVLKELGGFDPSLGMADKKIGYAEEDHLQIRIRQNWVNGLIYFDPQLLVYHLVASRKMSLRWRIKQQYSRGKSLAILKGNQKIQTDFPHAISKGIKTIIAIAISLLRGIFLRDLQQYPRYENWLYEVTALYFAHLGALVKSFDSKE